MLGGMKISRILLILLGLGLLLALASPLVGAWWLREYVSRERLILATEKNINARVDLEEVTLSIFTWPPSLRLEGIKLAPRDEHAGTPVATRPPLKDAPVQVDMAYLELLPDALWHRRFEPRVLRFIGVEVDEKISPQEGSSLQRLFLPSPEKMAQMQQQRQSQPPPDDLPKTFPVQPPPPPAPPQSGAARVGLQEISIEQAHFRISNSSAESQFNADISDFSLSFTQIDIDPGDITAHNHLHLRLAAKTVVDGVTKIGGQVRQVRFADMTLHGEGDVNPMDPATLLWSPAADLSLEIDRGSTIGGNLTIGETAGQHLDKLMKYGIDISAIRIGGTLERNVHAHILYREQSMRFLDDTQFVLPDYEYTIKRDSWMDFAKDRQGLLTRLSCGDALKRSLMQGISSRGLGGTISKIVVEALSDSRGRLSFDLTVSGSLSHPEVKPDILVKLEHMLGNDIEDKAKGLLNSLKGLKGLFK